MYLKSVERDINAVATIKKKQVAQNPICVKQNTEQQRNKSETEIPVVENIWDGANINCNLYTARTRTLLKKVTPSLTIIVTINMYLSFDKCGFSRILQGL